MIVTEDNPLPVMNAFPPTLSEESPVAPACEHLRAVSSAHRLRLHTVLVPLDCSDRSQPLLAGALSVARRLDADLVLLHVHDAPHEAPAHTTPQQLDEWESALHAAAQARLRETVREFGNDRRVRNARLLTVTGCPERAICEAANEIGADLILVATHGRCGFEHLFFGSKAEWIVRHAPCPVLVIPMRDVD